MVEHVRGHDAPRRSTSENDTTMSTKINYTFARNYAANTPSGMTVTVPDQVAAEQREFDGKSFPVLVRRPGNSPRKARATLRGDLYGLRTTGTGDMVVALRS